MKKILTLTSCVLAGLPLVAQTEGIGVERNGAIDEVTVYGTRTVLPLSRVANKIEVISPKMLAKAGDHDLTEVLKKYSSVDIIQYPGYLSSVGLRGFKPGGSYTTILVNGLPIGTDNISTLSVAGLEQIEVLKGPFSSIYGTSAMGGVVNLVTKKNKGVLTGHASITAGSFSTARFSASLGGRLAEGLSFDLLTAYDSQLGDYRIGRNSFLKKSPLERAILDESTYGSTFKRSSYGAFSGRLRVGYDFNERWSLNVYETLFIGNNLQGSGSFWGVYGEDKKDVRRSSTSLELEGRIGSHRLRLTPYYNHEQNYYYQLATAKTPEFVNSQGNEYSYGAVLQDNFQLAGHDLVVGVDSRNSSNKGRRYTSATTEIQPYRPAYTTNSLGAFAQANLKFLGDKLFVSAGVRADLLRAHLEANTFLKNEEKSETYTVISPNLGVKYTLAKGLQLHAYVGRSFYAPDAYQKAGYYQIGKTITEGNPQLKPEYSLTYDAGITYTSADKHLQADLTYFNTTHSDMIIREKNAKGNNSFVNADEGRIEGVEFMLSYDLARALGATFSLRPYLNGTWMLRAQNMPKGNTQWQDNLYIRKQNVTFGLDFATKQWEFSLNGRYAGKRYEQNFFSYYAHVRPTLASLLKAEASDLAQKGWVQHPAAVVFNASLAYNLTSNITLRANLQNALDENYTEKDGYSLAGRSLLFSLNCRF